MTAFESDPDDDNRILAGSVLQVLLPNDKTKSFVLLDDVDTALWTGEGATSLATCDDDDDNRILAGSVLEILGPNGDTTSLEILNDVRTYPWAGEGD